MLLRLWFAMVMFIICVVLTVVCLGYGSEWCLVCVLVGCLLRFALVGSSVLLRVWSVGRCCLLVRVWHCDFAFVVLLFCILLFCNC